MWKGRQTQEDTGRYRKIQEDTGRYRKIPYQSFVHLLMLLLVLSWSVV